MIAAFLGRRRCAVSGLVLVAVASLATAPSAPAALPKSGQYTGTTSEKSPVAFAIAQNGKTLTAFTAELGYDGKCGQGGGPTFSVDVLTITLSPSGRFTATTVGADNATKGTIRVTGRITGGSATGSIFEPKPFFACRAPHQGTNAYSETFTAKTK